MTYQIVNRNADTLILNVHDTLLDELAQELEQLRGQAQDLEEPIATSYTFAGQTLFIRPNGSGRQWRWLLFCGDEYIKLEVGKGKLNGICCKIRCSSLLLHERGIDGALSAIYRFLVDWLGGETFHLQVSEVHLCVDVAGWELTSEDRERFVSRAVPHDIPDEEILRLPEVTQRGRKIRAFSFSQKAPHSCLIYNKSQEVKIHHKEWFHAVWKANGWDGESPVFRIEFRYERECLRELGIEDPYDMLDQLGGMWAYSSQKWLRHTTPTTDTNQTRWPVSDVWVLVQAVTFDCDATPLVRTKKVELDAERAKAGFVGFATSWAVREVAQYTMQTMAEHTGLKLQGIPSGLPLAAVQEDGGGFLEWAFPLMQAYLDERKEQSFVEVMASKAELLGLPLAA